MKNLFLIACAGLALAGCATPMQPLPDVITVTTTEVPKGNTAISAAAQTALWSAHAAYNIPAKAYRTLDQAGQLPPDIKAKAKPALLQAYQALRLADGAAAMGDTVGVLFHTAEAKKHTAAAQAVVPAQ